MKGIKVTSFNDKLTTTTLMNIPLLKSGEVLIKMIYAPLNPADLALSKGVYGVKPLLPCTLGLEGVGKIVDCSTGIDQSLIGEIVSVYSHQEPGTFAEYKSAGLRNCMRHGKGEIADKMLKQYACGMINPLTSYGHLDIVRKRKQNVFVQSLAASQVGRMNIKLANKLGIEVINIIGKNDKPLIPELKQMGAGVVLFNEDPDFYSNIERIVKEKDAKVLFDGIGGTFLEKMAALMPNGSEFWSFGVMSRGFKIQIDINQLLFENKKYRGFWANKWIAQQGEEAFEKAKKETKLNIDQGLCQTKLSKVFKMEEIGQALTYYLKHMQEGKVLLKP